jgi:3-hydroxyacyl-CoA dehydrogenase
MAMAERSSASLMDINEAEVTKALGYLRDAEQAAGLVDHARHEPVTRAAVIGAGTMGTGIAMVLAEARIPVCIVDTSANVLRASLEKIRNTYRRAVESGKLSEDDFAICFGNISIAVDEREIAEVDLVIEAIIEDMEAKKSLFGKLDNLVKDDAILATNTSALDVNVLASATRDPSRVIGMHFFSPANKMRLLEVIRGKRTAPTILGAVSNLARRLGKIPVISEVCDGFIGNRMFEQYFRQALFLLEEGAMPWQVDQALEAWGMAMGPFRVMDVIGGDVPFAVRRRRYLERPDIVYSKIADEVCASGWLGLKSGRGFYDYGGAAGRLVNSDIRPIIENYSRRHGIERREIDNVEIVDRCVLALVNEAAAILDDGIAQRKSDIDVVFTAGFGFPKARGGPMYFADQLGLPYVVDRINHFQTKTVTDPGFWTPHPALPQVLKLGKRYPMAPIASLAPSSPQ